MGGVAVDQPYGILPIGPDPQQQMLCQNNRFLGSIAYVRAANKVDRWLGAALVLVPMRALFKFQDMFFIVEPWNATLI